MLTNIYCHEPLFHTFHLHGFSLSLSCTITPLIKDAFATLIFIGMRTCLGPAQDDRDKASLGEHADSACMVFVDKICPFLWRRRFRTCSMLCPISLITHLPHSTNKTLSYHLHSYSLAPQHESFHIARSSRSPLVNSTNSTMKITLLTLGLCATTFAAAIPSPILGLGSGATSDGHQITNPAFDSKANMNLDANVNAAPQGQGLGAATPAPATAAGLSTESADHASLTAEVADIEKLFGKRDVDLALEKREPATLTAYLIYCLKNPKKCRAVKVH